MKGLKKTISLNLFTLKNELIDFTLTPDDVTRPRETPWERKG